jgi:serine/arginine repetitive matrix protein 2
MYANESRPGTSSNGPNGADAEIPNDESGPALEVIELANGETIWSIVNGLRDDDVESAYGGRASFASEYSTREPNNDGVQVFFKEHTRKGSGSSFLSRKKTLQGKGRPETKVFYSSSAQIGRLIENLSQGMESGSFNIKPSGTPGSHSHSSSFHSSSDADMNWTVEERLEHMLGVMGGH